MVPFVPDKYGDKVSRAQLSTPMWQGGGVWLPSAEHFPAVGDFCNELAGFRGRSRRTSFDAMTQLFLGSGRRGGDDELFDREVEGLLSALGEPARRYSDPESLAGHASSNSMQLSSPSPP